MEKTLLVIFSILVSACASTVSRAQSATNNPSGSAQSAIAAGEAAAGTPETSTPPSNDQLDPYQMQTRQVVDDKVLLSLLKPFEKKYAVQCSIPTSDDPDNKNPQWTCLNNSACSYKVTITCVEKHGAHRPALQMEVEGFDSGSSNDIQALHITYLLK